MTNVFAVVGQHRAEPSRLLLLGDDGRYYAYAADGRPTAVEPSAAWILDAEGVSGEPVAMQSTGARPGPSHPPATDRRLRRQRRLGSAQRSFVRRPLLSAAIGLVMLLGIAAIAPPALAHAPALATAVADANLRSAPSPDAFVLGIVPLGATVELTGAAAGDYVEIDFGEQTGWAVASLLDADGVRPAVVTTDLNLRAAPFPDAQVLGVVPAGSTLLVTGATVDGFVAVSFLGASGWVSAAYLT